MARERFVWDERTLELVPAHVFYARQPARKTSDLPAPMVISDHLADVWNPVNGQRYDSKSAYYKAVRAAGCEIMGDEAPTTASAPRDDGPAIADIETSVAQAFHQHT